MERILSQLDKIYKDCDFFVENFKMNRELAEEEINHFLEYRDKAILGMKNARDYVIGYYNKILKTYSYEKLLILSDININNILKNNHHILLEAIIICEEFDNFINTYKSKFEVNENDLMNFVEINIDKIRVCFSMENLCYLIAKVCYSIQYGNDKIDSLAYEDISEIGITSKEYIYIIKKGQKVRLKFLQFNDNSIIESIQKKTTRLSNRSFDRSNPAIITSRLNSSRVTVAGYSIVSGVGDIYYNERIFNIKNITLENMKNKYHTIDNNIELFLKMNQKIRGSFFVTGSEMGVGKSTFLLSMIREIPNEYSIGIIDSQNELKANKKFKDKNIVTLVENDKADVMKCFEVMLRMSRDTIFVGEIAKPLEMALLIDSALRLDSGVGATFHTKRVEDVVKNARNLMMRTQSYNIMKVCEEDFVSAIDLIINLVKIENGRIIVESINELESIEDTYEIRTLIKYNKIKDKWDILSIPSNEYILKMKNKLNISEYNKVIKIFTSKRVSL